MRRAAAVGKCAASTAAEKDATARHMTPEQLVALLRDAQSGRLVAQMAAAYASACGMMAAGASLDAAAALPCMGLAALPHQVPAGSGMVY